VDIHAIIDIHNLGEVSGGDLVGILQCGSVQWLIYCRNNLQTHPSHISKCRGYRYPPAYDLTTYLNVVLLLYGCRCMHDLPSVQWVHLARVDGPKIKFMNTVGGIELMGAILLWVLEW
jgi:hypothetical protein